MLAITAFQRSGTTALGEQLGRLPSLAYWGEVFHPEGYAGADLSAKLRLRSAAHWFRFVEVQLPPELKAGPQEVEARARAWSLYEARLAEAGLGRRPVLDIKYNSWHHLQPVWAPIGERPFLVDLMAQSQTPIVHLVREDVLAQALSEVFAFNSGLWHRRIGQAVDLREMRFDADVEGLLHRMRASHRGTALMREWLKTTAHIELRYENTFSDTGGLTDGALSALAAIGVEASELSTSPVLGRMGQSPRDWLANSDEVVVGLQGTEFEPLAATMFGQA
jgi:hypothetical protein